MPAVFTGRTDELEQIRALLTQEKGPSATVVLGDPGVGKSRLLAEAARTSGMPTLRVIGFESEQMVPLAAASELLRELGSVPEHGPMLDEIVFHRIDTAPVRILEACHRALSSLGAVLLVVDDLQWLDQLSLALVHYLLRAADAGERSLALLAAGRRVARSIGFADDVTRLLPERSAVIDLRPLDPCDSVELARSLDPLLSDEEARLLCGQSGGLPFWIEMLVRSRRIPVDHRQLLTGRLHDADADTVSLLAMLAVVARPVVPGEAAELLEWPPERVEAGVDGLLSRGVATRAAGAISIAHDLLREAAVAALPERQRRQLHARVADWLQEGAEEDFSALREALEHRLGASQDPVVLASRLVSSPQRRRLGTEGLSVLAAISDETDGSTQGQALRHGVASLASELGEHRLALERWTALVALAIDEEGRFEALLAASHAALELGWDHSQQAHELVAAARACATTERQRVAAEAHEARIVLWLDHRTEEGWAIARRALERSRRLGSTPQEFRVKLQALDAARQAAFQHADGVEILRLAEDMVALTYARDEDSYVAALLALADGQVRTGGLEKAEVTVRASLQLAERRVMPLHEADAALALASILHDRTRLSEAEQTASKMHALTQRVQIIQPRRLIVHELLILRGEVEAGLSAYELALEELPDPHLRAWPRQIAATFLSRAWGDVARSEVASMLSDARQEAIAARCPRCQVTIRVAGAEALARVGCQAEAEAQLESADAYPPRDALNRYLRLHARAMVTAALDASAAATMLEEVCAEAERLDRRLELLWARVDLARLLSDRQRAADLLREVASTAEAVGATVPRLLADQELRRLGARTWRRGPVAGFGELTEREHQIGRLVASGASNPEIAQTLFLSRKTVEHHVSNVLAKLGARNRTELAALLARKD